MLGVLGMNRLNSFNSDDLDETIDEVLDAMEEQESRHERRIRDWIQALVLNADREVVKADIVRAHRIVKSSLATIDHGATITCDFSTALGKAVLKPMEQGLRASEELLDLAIEELEIPTYTSGLPPLSSCDL